MSVEIIEDREKRWRVTGAETLAGRYLIENLRKDGPLAADTLFHCEGSEEETDAETRNVGATSALLAQIGDCPPVNMVYLSSWQVYSPDAGEGVDESRPTFARSEAGRTKARCETILGKWCAERGVTLTVVRPALMFGKGIDGRMLRLFNRVIRGHYVHIRGNDSKMSAVTALDAACAMILLSGHPGIYNVSDGCAHTWLSLAEAMTANAGSQKRMTHLPEKWARWTARVFGWLPIVRETLSDEALRPFSQTLTLDNSKAVRDTGMTFYDTLAVIARTDKDYPYEDA